MGAAQAERMSGEGPPADAHTTQQNLTSAKEARKRAELDAQLLANRIALLKQEEEKAWAKINETRKRAQEITHLRHSNEQKYLAKEQFYKEKWDSIRSAQAMNAANRDRSKDARNQAKGALLANKKGQVLAGQQQSQDHMAQLKAQKESDRQANGDRCLSIKQQKLEAKRKMESDRQLQLAGFHQDYESRVSEEKMLMEKTHALVAQMEKEEMELIARLQNTQTVQRNAYEELENALGATSHPVATKAPASTKAQAVTAA